MLEFRMDFEIIREIKHSETIARGSGIREIKHPAASSGVLAALVQPAGFQPAFAPRGGELNPQRLNRLRKIHGPGNWRKGYASVRLPDGSTCIAEIHWYEATGIGKREFKIKRYMDITS